MRYRLGLLAMLLLALFAISTPAAHAGGYLPPPPVQQAAGNIDYAHAQGDYLYGRFCGYYQVTLSNEGVLFNGEKNNGLYIEQYYGCQLSPPQLDYNLTLFNGCPVLNSLAYFSCVPPSNGSNPMTFVIYLDAPYGVQLSTGECRGPGVGGNVFVQLNRLNYSSY